MYQEIIHIYNNMMNENKDEHDVINIMKKIKI
jgi:hypothetical protein